MGYDEFQKMAGSKIEVYSEFTEDIGKTVIVKCEKGGLLAGQTIAKTFDENLTLLFELFPVPGRYSVSLINGDTTEWTKEVIMNFGEYKKITAGFNKTTIQGFQSLLNAHKERVLSVGDEVPIEVVGWGAVPYQIGAINQYSAHDLIMVPKYLYPTTRQMQTSNTNVGGFNKTLLYTWLQNDFFAMLPEDVQEMIVDTVQITSTGNQATTTQQTKGKIFIPTEFEVFGKTTYATTTEQTNGNTQQWEIFKETENRIRKLGNADGAATWWWECSPYASDATGFCYVNTGGSTYAYFASSSSGVLPCFRIAAQEAEADDDES
jgi:hypothetical protein